MKYGGFAVASRPQIAHTGGVRVGWARKESPVNPIIGILSALAASTAISAAVIRVPEDYSAIQAGIDAAAPGDTVLVGSGVWAGWLNFRGKDITLESSDGPEVTTIDGGESPSAVAIFSGETTDAVLRGFTIIGQGSGTLHEGVTQGAGIYILNSSPTIEDCIVRDCSAMMGGGISIWHGDPVLRNVIVRNNWASIDGGGMRIHHLSSPVLEECEFLDNGADVYGGALAYGNDSDGIHEECIFDGNSAGIRGGGISKTCDCSDARISNSTLCNNFPDHVLGTWDDLGGNTVCAICSNDVTADGVVDVNDVLAIIAAWGGCVCVEDINGDSAVDVDDLLAVLGSYGPCP
ncbi:MAG: hypothetical protein CMJ63_00535 [Planctomycetaceae bacterium]|nr:hypothetical protein [Planctomycetaceae bacterium]HCA38461.1 hypothetical protein [Phycisphaerales bacterium]